MPDQFLYSYKKFRRLLKFAKEVLGLVLLFLEFLRRISMKAHFSKD